ncbi:MAG: Galanin [Candidatus Omnitrophota bacterium]|nr:MAG: Galanin [Candidatus Omnitrophota bacterium]
MKTLAELKKYYQSDLLPDLEVLEQQRKKIINNLSKTAVPVILIALVLMLLFRNAVVFIAIFSVVGLGIAYNYLIRDYVFNFKREIIKKIIKSIDAGLTYQQSMHISEQLFRESKIFSRRPDRFKGDDFVSGLLGKTKIEFSEIYAQYVTRDSKGRTTYHTIFKGLFIAADFNKEFKSTTVVLPDTAEKLFGNFGTMLQSWNKTRGQLIKLEDPEFEKLFAVYGNDQIEARYVLSTSLMKRVVDFKNKTGKKIYLSFVRSKIFVAISYHKDLFEPKVFSTVLSFTPIKEYFENLRLAVDIVEDLNLNTRIWGKT